jgi:hypothetical protein
MQLSDGANMYIQHLQIFMSNDDGYNPELAGKVVFNPNNDPDHESYEVDKPQGLGYMYFYENTHEFTIRPNTINSENVILDPSFNFEGYQIIPIEGFLSNHIYVENTPQCSYYVPSMFNDDSAIELYNWPFTLLPIKDSCICPSLGNNPKSAGTCGHASSLDFKSCGHYKAEEEIALGTVDINGKKEPVTLVRGSLENEYRYADQVFSTYNKFNDHLEENNLEFDYTYNPINSESIDFFSKALGRMEKTYAKIKN